MWDLGQSKQHYEDNEGDTTALDYLVSGVALENAPKYKAIEQNQTEDVNQSSNDVFINDEHLGHILAQIQPMPFAPDFTSHAMTLSLGDDGL
jgi:hypothetical protein